MLTKPAKVDDANANRAVFNTRASSSTPLVEHMTHLPPTVSVKEKIKQFPGLSGSDSMNSHPTLLSGIAAAWAVRVAKLHATVLVSHNSHYYKFRPSEQIERLVHEKYPLLLDFSLFTQYCKSFEYLS